MNYKRLIIVILTTAVLVLAGTALSSCSKSQTGETGSYSVLVVCNDSASQAQATKVQKAMLSVINNTSGGNKDIQRMDSAIIAICNPIYTNYKNSGNFVISIVWNGLTSDESINIRDFIFTKAD